MTYTRKQAVTCISILYLIIVTAVAGYASSRISRLSIPIADGLAYATTLLPLVAGLLLEGGYDFTRLGESRKLLPQGDTTRPPFVIVANTLIFIYSTVVITLLGTHAAPPSGLDCGLRERWTSMFSHKNVHGIRTIQDAFKCCGLKHSRDMAWPFPDKTHDVRSCEAMFGHTNGCLGAWKGEEQRMAGLLMGMVGMVFIWQFAIIAIPTQRESWLHQVVPGSISSIIADEEHGSGRRAIDYLPNFNAYTDRVEDASDDEADNGPRRTIGEATERVGNILGGSNNQGDRQNQPVDNEWSRP